MRRGRRLRNDSQESEQQSSRERREQARLRSLHDVVLSALVHQRQRSQRVRQHANDDCNTQEGGTRSGRKKLTVHELSCAVLIRKALSANGVPRNTLTMTGMISENEPAGNR